MLVAAAAGTSQPVVAALLGLGASGLAGAVVAMAWSVHTRQIRLAELLTRRQFIVTGEPAVAGQALNGHVDPDAALVNVQEALEAVGAQGAREAQAGQKAQAAHGAQGLQGAQEAQGPQGAHPAGAGRAGRAASAGRTPKLVIEGPETVVVGEQVRYRVRPTATGTAVTWAVGGGSVSQAPDPTHPDELLLIADQPGSLMLHVRVREGLSERRETKSLTAVPDVTPVASPFPLRLFLQGWGLVVVAVLVVGFAAALVALGNLTSADFIALAAPLTALLGVLTAVRGTHDPAPQLTQHRTPAGPEP
jgi:hypothetical protein